MTRRHILAAVQAGLGLLLVVSAVALYWQYPRFMYELTFMSNFCAGLFFLAAGGCTWQGRRTPPVLSLCFTVLLLLVMGICLAFSGNFSFSGAFLFLHLLNPLAVLAYFFGAVDMGPVRPGMLWAVLVMPLAYLVFAVLFGRATGNYIYFFLDYGQVGLSYTILFIAAAAGALALAGWLLWLVNQLLRRPGKKAE